MRKFPGISGAVAFVVMFALLARTAVRADTQSPKPCVLVVFDHPEKFTYGTDSQIPSDAERNQVLTMFRDYITQRAASYLPDGCCLYITFANIDLSAIGPVTEGVESRHGGVVGATTSYGDPMFDFGWAITDRSGSVRKKGSAKLAPYRLGLVELQSEAFKIDSHHFEKARLDDWMRDNLRS